MSDSQGRLIVALLVVPESSASTLYGMYELLASAGRDWGLMVGGSPGESLIVPLLVSVDGKPIRTQSGLAVEPGLALEDCPTPDVIAIPDLLVAPGDGISGRYRAEIDWLKHHYANGVAVATACSGALLLGEAGLLDDQDATTHWAYCDTMAQRYPAVRIHPNRALVISGECQNLIMAGGGTTWYDLALFLIARYVGIEEAMRVARMYLLDWHHIGQQPFAALTRTRRVEDSAIARCLGWIAENYEHISPVAAMAGISGLPERSFKRRFLRATGMTPLEYVHTVRLEETKHLLEVTRSPIEAVANEVGYQDPSFFGRLFRRKVGLTPAQYRRRFAALRQALEPAADGANDMASG